MRRSLLIRNRDWLAAVLLLCMPWSVTPALSAVIAYNSQASFNAATAGWVKQTTDFEGVATGTTFAAGTGPAGSGFTLNAKAAGSTPTVADLFWTTSGTHYLGLDDSDTQFFSGDELTFNFANPTSAFGLFVIGGQDLRAGDVRLSGGGTDAFNAATADLTDNNGSFAFFIGLASSGATLSSATLTGIPPGGTDFFLFAVDDVVLAHPGSVTIPEPPCAVLIALALLAVVVRRRPRESLPAQSTPINT